MESVMDRVAVLTGLDPSVVREANMYTERTAITAYLQPIIGLGFSLPRVWERIQTIKRERHLKHSIDVFNKANKWRKRGLAVAPVKYGVAPLRVGALVSVDADGTVTITHGGVEVGQGIHTRVAQVAAYTLGAPMHCVRVADTNTDVVSQISVTGGSATHGNACEAVRLACLKINNNLARAVDSTHRRNGAVAQQAQSPGTQAEGQTIPGREQGVYFELSVRK
jgi:xanthine dehydrogenase molybdopterin-binding subunit B